MAETMPNPRPPEGSLSGNPSDSGRTAEAVRAEIDALRRREGADLKPFEVQRRVAELVWTYLACGKFFRQGSEAYYQPAEAETILAVSRDDTSFCVLLDDLGLNPAEGIFSVVLEHLRLQTHRAGAPELESAPAGMDAGGLATSAVSSCVGAPAIHSQRVKLCEAAEIYDIPKSVLSKAAKKSLGAPGFLRSEREGRNVFFFCKDLERFERSRKKLRR
jgi:hypothetical protein